MNPKKEYDHKRYLAKKEEYIARARKYAQDHPEAHNRHTQKWRESHREYYAEKNERRIYVSGMYLGMFPKELGDED